MNTAVPTTAASSSRPPRKNSGIPNRKTIPLMRVCTHRSRVRGSVYVHVAHFLPDADLRLSRSPSAGMSQGGPTAEHAFGVEVHDHVTVLGVDADHTARVGRQYQRVLTCVLTHQYGLSRLCKWEYKLQQLSNSRSYNHRCVVHASHNTTHADNL
jgi:hypothetical protein